MWWLPLFLWLLKYPSSNGWWKGKWNRLKSWHEVIWQSRASYVLSQWLSCFSPFFFFHFCVFAVLFWDKHLYVCNILVWFLVGIWGNVLTKTTLRQSKEMENLEYSSIRVFISIFFGLPLCLTNSPGQIIWEAWFYCSPQIIVWP